MHILLAEDERINQLYMSDLLARSGYTVAVASDGQSVLEQVAHTRFDLILMDIRMPIMDGLEATRRIRNAAGQATDAAVPIVGMTAHSTNEDRESFAAYGVTEVIEKPVAEPELLARLESYAEGNR